MENEIKVGDTVSVRYLDDGPTMSVQSIEGDGAAKCALWSDFKQEYEYMYYNVSVLKKVIPEE